MSALAPTQTGRVELLGCRIDALDMDGTVLNSIVTNFKTWGVKIDDDVTWDAHCAAIPAPPALFCSANST